MDNRFLSSLLKHYQWQLSIHTAVGIALVTVISRHILMLVPTLRAARRLNDDAYRHKMEQPNYAANQQWNRR